MSGSEQCLDQDLNITAYTHTVELPPTIFSTDPEIYHHYDTDPLVLASITDSVYKYVSSLVV